MKSKIIIIILMAAIFTACSGTKRVSTKGTNTSTEISEQKEQVAQTIESKVEEKKESSTDTRSQSQSDEKQQQDIEIITVKYDTEKPINPETGKPPVASETIVRKVSSKSKQEKNLTTTTGRESTDYKSDQAEILMTNEQSKTNKTSSESSTITTKTKANKNWVIPIILIVAAAIGVYAIYKYFRCW